MRGPMVTSGFERSFNTSWFNGGFASLVHDLRMPHRHERELKREIPVPINFNYCMEPARKGNSSVSLGSLGV